VSPVPERPAVIPMPPPPARDDRSSATPPPDYAEKIPLKSPRQSPTKSAQNTSGNEEHYKENEVSLSFDTTTYGSTKSSEGAVHEK